MDTEKTKGIIFDLDGTLYEQRPVRRRMFVSLLKYYVLHIWQWRELYGIFVFRRIREMDEYKYLAFEKQIEHVSRRVKINPRKLHDSIQYWMFQYPLFLIEKFKDEEILHFLHSEQDDGKKVIVYSDYPVEQKLDCLQVEPDYMFYPGTNGIDSLKPSLKAMQCILSTVRLEPEELLFIGDRMDKDGESAKLVGMPFVLVHDNSKLHRGVGH